MREVIDKLTVIWDWQSRNGGTADSDHEKNEFLVALFSMWPTTANVRILGLR